MADVQFRSIITRDGKLAWLFLAGRRYAMLELDADGDVVAGLSDRVGAASDYWIVPRGGADDALRRIRGFLEPYAPG